MRKIAPKLAFSSSHSPASAILPSEHGHILLQKFSEKHKLVRGLQDHTFLKNIPLEIVIQPAVHVLK